MFAGGARSGIMKVCPYCGKPLEEHVAGVGETEHKEDDCLNCGVLWDGDEVYVYEDKPPRIRATLIPTGCLLVMQEVVL